MEREKRERIERENQILLQKILDCHIGQDRARTSGIPSARRSGRSASLQRGGDCLSLLYLYDQFYLPPAEYPGSPDRKPGRSSYTINARQAQLKTDYENLILLKRILSAKPSKAVKIS